MILLMVVHGISELLIFEMPVYLVIGGAAPPGLLLVSLGGALIGVGGLLLSFLKTGRPILSYGTILNMLPLLLLHTTVALTTGFGFR